MNKPRDKSQQFKILRSNDFARRAVVFECGSLSTRLSSTRSTVDIATSVGEKQSRFRIPRNLSSGMAALLRAVADDLEQL